ncbi:hypothetical protein JQK62_19890, partial [Leptospira santarosai]|nr:hypothetical protein [Leptospira santarosai]
INSGGLIQVADELYGINHARVLANTKHIYDAILEVYEMSMKNGISTMEAANKMCEKRIGYKGNGNRFFTVASKPKWSFR